MNQKILQIPNQDEMEQEFHIQMQREIVLQKLKEEGFRITKQRIAVIDIILENDCSSCKEIFYKTAKINKKIGAATIYRTLNILEEIGAINRKNLYKFSYREEPQQEAFVLVTLEDGQVYHLNLTQWDRVMQLGMQACGYGNGEKIISVLQQNTENSTN